MNYQFRVYKISYSELNIITPIDLIYPQSLNNLEKYSSNIYNFLKNPLEYKNSFGNFRQNFESNKYKKLEDRLIKVFGNSENIPKNTPLNKEELALVNQAYEIVKKAYLVKCKDEGTCKQFSTLNIISDSNFKDMSELSKEAEEARYKIRKDLGKINNREKKQYLQNISLWLENTAKD
jgi:hypothetical protein